MKKITRLYLLMSMSLFLCGCVVQSLYPFYTQDSKIEFTDINGEWELIKELGDEVDEDIKPWVIKDGYVKTYDDKGREGGLTITVFKVEDALFLDSYPEGPSEEVGFWWTMHIFPFHTVCKIKYEDNLLRIVPLNYGWLKKKITAGEIDLSYADLKKEEGAIFFSSAEDWIAFLKEYKDDPKAFSLDNEIVLKRKVQ